MVAHQHKAIELDRIDFQGLGKKFKKFITILVILEDCFPLIATVSDMIQGARIFDAKWAGHT